MLSSDTVPFALWSASRTLGSVVECFWSTVAGLGDRDTTCAIACGVVGTVPGTTPAPADWVSARESLELEVL